MANFNTITALVGGTGRGQIAVLALTSTTETVFAVNTDTTGTTAAATINVPTGAATDSSGHPLLVGAGSPLEYNQNGAISSQSYGRKSSVFTEAPYFSTKTFDAGRSFKIRINGTASVSAVSATTLTNTVQVNLYWGTSVSSGNQLATLSVAGTNHSTTAAVTGQFELDTIAQWDSTTGTLSGWYLGNNMNTFTAAHALSHAVAVTSATNLQFIAAAVFGDTAGGSVTVAEMAIDQE